MSNGKRLALAPASLKWLIGTLVVLVSAFGATGASASTVLKPTVSSVAALPAELSFHGGSVTIAAQLEHATECRLELLSHQAFPVVYANNWRPCTTALVAHVTVGANPTPIERTVALELVARDGPATTSRQLAIKLAPGPSQSKPVQKPSIAVRVSPTTLSASGGSVTISFSSHGVADCTLTELPPGMMSSVPCNGTQEIWVPSATAALSYDFTFSGLSTLSAANSVATAKAVLRQAGPGPTTTTGTPPPAPPTTAPTTTTIPTTPNGPPINYDTSDNWSGYVLHGSGMTSVSGTFTVPEMYNTAQCNETDSDWVGVDGSPPGNSNLVQAGISESMLNPSTGTCGADVYFIQAWWEILPAGQVNSSIPVEVGDSVTVSIGQGSPGFWDISLTDNTNGQGFSVQEPYSGPATSAEWITEAYTVNGTQTPIAPFSPVTWSALQIPSSATVSDVDAIVLQQGGNTEVGPSNVLDLQNLLGSGFTTTYVGGD